MDKQNKSSARRMSRRSLLKLGAAGAAGLPLATPMVLARQLQSAPASTRPKNVIFMIADGMSPGVPAMAQLFSQILGRGDTQWQELARDPAAVHGQFDMASLNSPVTDSAAAASSWGSGSRVFNNVLNMLPDGRPLTPIGVLAKRAGHGVGLVTTTRITHATPAGFAASAANRDDEQLIAPQYLDTVDVLLGGGRDVFHPPGTDRATAPVSSFEQRKYKILSTRSELLNAKPADRILGLFSRKHLPYTIDTNRDQELAATVPTVAEMTAFALMTLSANTGGFLLQVEGGRVDHAAHNNDAAAMLWDQLAFDQAIGEAVEFCRRNPDTLLIITSDHGCGNPGLNGLGDVYQHSGRHFEKLASATASLEAMQQRLAQSLLGGANPLDGSAIIDVLRWGSGIEIEPKEGQIIAAALAGTPPPELNQLEANVYAAVAQILGNHHGVAWTGIAHTSDWVPILAYGAGSERFKGLLKNTDAFTIMAEAFGIEHRNPSMTEDEAKKFSARRDGATLPHYA